MDTWGIQAPVSPRTSSVLILILAASRNISIYDPTTKTFICIKYFFLFPDNTFLERDSDIESFLFFQSSSDNTRDKVDTSTFHPPDLDGGDSLGDNSLDSSLVTHCF